MGWWSYNVMGGDTPLDHLDNIAEICGLHRTADNPYNFTKDILEKNLERIALNIQNDDMFTDDNEIAWQVLGHLVLEHNIDLPPAIRGYIIASFEWDEYAKRKPERKQVMEDYVSRLRAKVLT